MLGYFVNIFTHNTEMYLSDCWQSMVNRSKTREVYSRVLFYDVIYLME
jgi:hypothetical protein